MLLRFTLGAAGAMVLASTAAAQVQTGNLQPVTSPVKDAGTYHMATGTWTRNTGATALVGPSQLYDNTCTVGYYTGLNDGTTAADSGRIPSQSDGGLYNNYEVNCFSLAYCTFEPVSTTLGLAYYDCYSACDGLTAASPVVAYALVNVPGGGTAGTQGCWILTFNLTNTTFTFNLGGDCNGNYDNVPSTDHFGWSWTQLVPTTGSNAGPLLAGDPLGNFNVSCGLGQGAGTDHGTGSWGTGNPTGPGTGIGTDIDQMEFNGGGLTGCFWFGGYNSSAGSNPLASFYHKLWGGERVGGDDNQGDKFCFGDTGNCPGGAVGSANSGCPHGQGPNGANGAMLSPIGSADFGADTYGFALTSGPTSLGILIQGAAAIGFPNGNNSVPDSAGLFCVAPQLRGFIEFTPDDTVNAGDSDANLNITTFQGAPFGASAQPVGNATYNQFWFRDTGNPNANPGPGAEFNFSNAVETFWQ